jgi:hypothetical protein
LSSEEEDDFAEYQDFKEEDSAGYLLLSDLTG